MDYGKPGLEEHMDRVLKGSETAWKSYKGHLARMLAFFKSCEFPRVNVEEGNAYIRFQTMSDDCNLNKIYLIFEIGDIFPQIRWRNLIRRTLTYTPVMLHKRACFLPVYSYSLDKLLTLVYWGEKQFLLNPEQLRRFNIKSFLFTIPCPSNCLISAANFVWLKSIEEVWHNSASLLELSKYYVFNSLYPPDIVNKFNPWHESPFILIGDRMLDIFTLHKTICYLDLDTAKKSGWKEFFKLRAYILDNKLNIEKIECLMLESYLSLLERIPITEAIVIKHLRIFDKASLKKPLFEIIIYPFETTNLFKGERIGSLITAMSIVLRYLYLKSEDPLRLRATIEEVRHKILDIFRNSPFNQYKWNDVASQLLRHPKGVVLLAQALDVYYATGDKLIYLHPSIIESLSVLYGGFDMIFTMKIEDLKSLILRLLQIIERIKCQPEKFLSFTQLIDLREIMRNKLGLSIAYDDLKRFILSLMIAWESIIPISKFLSSFTG